MKTASEKSYRRRGDAPSRPCIAYVSGAAACALLMTATGCVSEPEPQTSDQIIAVSPEEEEYIDSLFVDYAGEQPGASVMIAVGDDLLLCKGYGLAVLEPAADATCDTNFRLGSVSKQFTAMAVLKLVDQEMLTLETSLTDIFPDFPEYGQNITVKHLLTHQSGLIAYDDLAEMAENEGRKLTDTDVVHYLESQNAIYFHAGAEWGYSNSGYAVLAAIVAQVSGMSFEDFMTQEILKPSGMTNAGYDRGNATLSNQARPYLLDGEAITPTPQHAASGIRGDGSLYVSARDFFHWHLALTTNRLLSPELQEAAFEPQSGDNKLYGFGWFTPQDTPIRIVEHGGASRSGFIAFMIHAPERDITVAVFVSRTFTGENRPSLNLKARANALFSIATNGGIPRPNAEAFQE